MWQFGNKSAKLQVLPKSKSNYVEWAKNSITANRVINFSLSFMKILRELCLHQWLLKMSNLLKIGGTFLSYNFCNKKISCSSKVVNKDWNVYSLNKSAISRQIIITFTISLSCHLRERLITTAVTLCDS